MKTVRIEPTNCYELSVASLRIEQDTHRKIMPLNGNDALVHCPSV